MNLSIYIGSGNTRNLLLIKRECINSRLREIKELFQLYWPTLIMSTNTNCVHLRLGIFLVISRNLAHFQSYGTGELNNSNSQPSIIVILNDMTIFTMKRKEKKQGKKNQKIVITRWWRQLKENLQHFRIFCYEVKRKFSFIFSQKNSHMTITNYIKKTILQLVQLETWTWKSDILWKKSNGKGKPRKFFLIYLPFVHRAHRSWSFVCLLTKKQTEVFRLQMD
jgi:hypothetical protein